MTDYKFKIEVGYHNDQDMKSEAGRLRIIARTYDPGAMIIPDTITTSVFFRNGEKDAENFRVALKKECDGLVARCDIFDLSFK